jgi:acyl-CoA synthetase (AMP-forming)/AMP-acid ligase II
MSQTVEGIEPARRGELALADERTRYSWSELDPVLNRAANALQGLGARRAAVFAPNSAETVLAYLAGLEAGVSTAPVSFHLTAGEGAYILRDSEASVLFVGPETLATGLAAAQEAGVGTVIGWRCPPTDGLIAWEDWLAAASEAPPPVDVKPAPHLHYTSGTTGRPKGTETPPQFFPDAPTVAAFAELMRERATPSPGLAVGPLYHTGPLSMVRSLLGGTALVVMEKFDPEQVLATIARERIVGTVMVPTHFQRLLALPSEVRAKYDVSSMQRLGHTGAACPREVKRAMIDWFGPVLVEAYGATESGTTNLITSEEWLRKPGSVGVAQPPFEALILGDDGRELPAGQEGRLYFRDVTGRGIVYRNDPEKTAAAHFAPGVFTLGEVGYMDEDGYVFITDRVSDMIVSGGVNIYPAEAEQVLMSHPAIADVAVVGAPNADMGEEARALVVPRDPAAPPSTEELNRFCRDRLAGFKCPRAYDFVDDLGRNAMGKVNKRTLRERYWPTGRTIGG